jgi:hypothetical protein
MAELARRIGSDKRGLLEWMRGNVASLEAELASPSSAAQSGEDESRR